MFVVATGVSLGSIETDFEENSVEFLVPDVSGLFETVK
jgi:hypothetical protein